MILNKLLKIFKKHNPNVLIMALFYEQESVDETNQQLIDLGVSVEVEQKVNYSYHPVYINPDKITYVHEGLKENSTYIAFRHGEGFTINMPFDFIIHNQGNLKLAIESYYKVVYEEEKAKT